MPSPRFALVLPALFLLMACGVRDADLISRNQSVADDLIAQAQLVMDAGRPVLVAPFMEVNHLNEYTPLGSITAEQMAGRLAQDGFKVLDVKLDRETLYTLQGEAGMLLSDELRNLSTSVGAQAVLIGTYAVGERTVFVTARLVRASDNMVLAAENYELPLGPDTEALLGDTDGSATSPRRWW